MTVTALLADLAQGIPSLPEAACRGTNVMDVANGRERAAITRAKAVCAACPVQPACAAWLEGLPKTQRPSGVVAGRYVPPPKVRPLREPKPRPPTKRDAAARWLTAYLANGPAVSTEVRAAAVKAGHGLPALAAAARRLGVQYERLDGQPGGYRTWTLPGIPNTRRRNTMDTLDNDDMTRPARAGDTRRMWNAVLHYEAGDTVGLEDVMAQAENVGRGHHLVFALIEYLADALQLGSHPDRVDEIRREIARLNNIETQPGEDAEQ